MIFVFQITEVGPAAPRPRRTKTLIRLNRTKPLVSPAPEAAKHQTLSTEPMDVSYPPVSLSEFSQRSVMRVLKAASKCTVAKFIPGNMAHFFRQRMTNPVSALLSDMNEQDDSYPNLACELIAKYPGCSMDAYAITSAMLVLSVRFGMMEHPDDLIDTLSVKPSHLSVTASGGVPAGQRLVVGNYTLSNEDMSTLKPKHWLNDNVSTACIILFHIRIYIEHVIFMLLY